MLCEMCKKNKPTVHFKQVHNGTVKEMFVCEECAVASGLDLQAPVALTDFLFGEAQAPEHKKKTAEDRRCKNCGLPWSRFVKMTRLGCPSCYESFSHELTECICAMQGEIRQHRGKAPRGENETAEIASLQLALKQAISSQNFEEAAKLRDRMRELEAARKHESERAERNAGSGASASSGAASVPPPVGSLT